MNKQKLVTRLFCLSFLTFNVGVTNLWSTSIDSDIDAISQMTKDIAVKGVVRDNKGEPIIGANIMEEGTTNGTITDIDGNFILKISKGSKLVVSYIGFLSQTVVTDNKDSFEIILKEDTEQLDEVVVVGFGHQKKASIVGSITTLDPQKLQTGTSRSMTNNLAGQVAGVIAVQRSGEPGKDASNFWIRGISSFTGNTAPLVLVDGIERSLDNIDPAEIESFSVLKDASASAVYGVRGANGVILINTKRGQKGKLQVDVRFEQGFTFMGKQASFINSADHLALLDEINRENGIEPLYGTETIEKYRLGVDPDLYPNVNWVDEITEDMATNTRANVTIGGGSDILRYSFVASVYNEKGIISRDKSQEWDSSINLNRYNVRSNFDINLTKSTLARINIGGYLQDLRGGIKTTDELYAMAQKMPPFVHPAKYSSGEIPKTAILHNPWAEATQLGYQTNSQSKIESLLALEQDFGFWLPGLKAKITASFDRFQGNGVIRQKEPDYYNPASGRDENGDLILTLSSQGQPFLGYGTTSEWGYKRTYIEANISYDHIFNDVHSVSAMFMGNRTNYDNGDRLPFRKEGIAGRLSYTYDSRYIGEFNFGYNGSENFAKGSRYGFFPSIALGWLISEEDFMESYRDVINKLKLRASYGLVGNDNLGGTRFAYITTIAQLGTWNPLYPHEYRWGVNNDYVRQVYMEGNIGVSNLTWELVKKFNVGVELNLYNALDVQVDYFYDRRSNIFLQRQTLPGSLGFVTTPYQNFGRAENKGIDLSMIFNKQITKDFNLSARGTFTYVTNKIIEMDEPDAIKGTYRAQTGRSINQLFGFVDDGLFTDDDFVVNENGVKVLAPGIPVHTFGAVRPGDIKYKDLNGDGMITEVDQTAIGGTVDPKIVYGFGLNMSYKDFDFSCFFQGNAMTDRIIGDALFMPGSGGTTFGNVYDNYQDRWTPDNPSQDVFYPRLTNGLNPNNSKPSTWWLKDMSMLRLKTIELGYNLPKEKCLPNFIKSARLFLTGNNLLQFSGFDMWDPELATVNGMKYPIMKSVSVGFNVVF